ncbi:hypothetical protein BDZ89DRAFT_1110729 [Hymenopellis radicata]|nr:hypothetical protein BDZ89DRAFT_1110729 [Hymenopellis radicata]
MIDVKERNASSDELLRRVVVRPRPTPSQRLEEIEILGILGRRQQTCVHRRSTLPYPIEKGLGRFLPPLALKLVAVDYQDGLLERLNDEARGTEYENMTVVDTVLNAVTQPTHALTYSYASLALNNHFFLDHLKPLEGDAKNHQDKIDPGLLASIGTHYDSVARLKSVFSAVSLEADYAGYVWLVTDKSGRLAVVSTSGAESLVIQGRFVKSQDRPPTEMDMYTDDLPTSDPYYEDWLEETQTLDPQGAALDRVMAQVQADETGELAEAVLEEMGEVFPEVFREGKGLDSLDPDLLNRLLGVLESETVAETGTLPSEDSPIFGERHASPSDQNTDSPESTLPAEEYVPPSDWEDPPPPDFQEISELFPEEARWLFREGKGLDSLDPDMSNRLLGVPESEKAAETGTLPSEDSSIYGDDASPDSILPTEESIPPSDLLLPPTPDNPDQALVEDEEYEEDEDGLAIEEDEDELIEEDEEYDEEEEDEDEEYDEEEEAEGVEETEDENGERSPEEEQAYWDNKRQMLRAQVQQLKAEQKESLLDGIIYPLFCAPVHEHGWMSAGYGVLGQEEWLKQFWTVLDWEKVSTRYRAVTPRLQ